MDLATKYNGEIINGDAMQMYDGLPIITNKITVEEQNGIPHHLLGIVGLEDDPWTVAIFKKRAGKVIRDIRERGKLPIVVGGTHYYTQSLLFTDSLVEEPAPEQGETEDQISRDELNRMYPILARPTEEIFEKLKEVDPVMADRWHPNDRRRIQRSMEIFLTTGKQASKIYEEQRMRKLEKLEITGNDSIEEPPLSLLSSTIIFWVHAKHDVLNRRLDERVEKMVANGLIDEVSHLDAFLQTQTAAGVAIDRTSAIWVSIGFKEFEPYLTAKQDSTKSIFDTEAALINAVERTKIATRQYARRQIKWIRIKLLAALSGASSLNSLYLLNGSDLSKWSESVSNPALDVLGRFLAGEELPSPAEMSPEAKDLLTPKQDYDLSDRTDLWVHHECEFCHVTIVIEDQWQRHLKSRRHRKLSKKKERGGDIGQSTRTNPETVDLESS